MGLKGRGVLELECASWVLQVVLNDEVEIGDLIDIIGILGKVPTPGGIGGRRDRQPTSACCLPIDDRLLSRMSGNTRPAIG
mmetsp:Transcript_50296/g.109215  ORF Transcript_50296/g.109215 Transcript_50296/m.109215 type:complete len:81 (+) Transcript_50296:350-592(+)